MMSYEDFRQFDKTVVEPLLKKQASVLGPHWKWKPPSTLTVVPDGDQRQGLENLFEAATDLGGWLRIEILDIDDLIKLPRAGYNLTRSVVYMPTFEHVGDYANDLDKTNEVVHALDWIDSQRLHLVGFVAHLDSTDYPIPPATLRAPRIERLLLMGRDHYKPAGNPASTNEGAA